MSLILEALKKSEAERRLGQAPGLMTPMGSAPRKRRGAWPWTLGVGLLGLVLLASGAWYWTRRPVPAATAPDSAVSGPRDDAAMRVVGTQDSGGLSDRAPATDASGVSVDPASSPRSTTAPAPPAAPSRPAPASAAVPTDPDFRSVERESVAAPAVLPDPPPAPVPEAIEPAPPTVPEASEPALPRLAELPLETRNALPPLRQSMHVFNETPETRFVLIDGRRYGEGEKLAPSLQIIRIRREGTELDFDGRRFLLPRP